MKSELFKIIGIFSVIAAAVAGFAMQPEKPFPDENLLAELLPDAVRFSTLKNEPVEHWLGFEPNGRAVGAVFLTDRVAPEVPGYGGELRAAVGLRREGKLTGVKVLHHEETPAYYRRLGENDFLSHFNGIALDSNDAWARVDAVTGATITSDALRDDVHFSARTVAAKIFGLPYPSPPARPFPWFQVAGLLAVFALSFLATYRRERFWRGLSLTGGVLVVGVWLNASFSLQTLTGLLQGRFLDLDRPIPLLMLLFVALTGLTRGRQYCRTLCPYGALQETLGSLAPRRVAAHPGMSRWLSNLPYFLLFLALVLALLEVFPVAIGLEPFQHLFAWSLCDGITLAFGIGVLMLSFVSPRFWCRFFCPSGAAMALWARLRFWRNTRHTEAEDIGEEVVHND